MKNKCLTIIKSFILTYFQKITSKNYTEIPLHPSRIAVSMKKTMKNAIQETEKG